MTIFTINVLQEETTENRDFATELAKHEIVVKGQHPDYPYIFTVQSAGKDSKGYWVEWGSFAANFHTSISMYARSDKTIKGHLNRIKRRFRKYNAKILEVRLKTD